MNGATSFYTKNDIRRAYAELGVAPGRLVYLTSDLGRLWRYEKSGKTDVLSDHLEVLTDLLGPNGTLVVPAATGYLCNTEEPFDPDASPSRDVGALSEYIRLQAGSLRSFHPFVSYVARGCLARDITENASRHAFGPFSPEARMLEADALSISVGLPITHTASTVHHVEFLMSVPYRYTKEYLHPVVRSGKVVREPFYQHVWYRNSDVKRSWNREIVARFAADGMLTQTMLGRGQVYAYSMRNFVDSVMRMIRDDPYIWCDFPPTIRPWQI